MRIEYLTRGPFLQWWTMAPDPDWSVPFGRTAPLDLEIGFGNGEFLAREAVAHPDRNFLGVDRRWSGAARALRFVGRAGARNVRLLQMDARVLLQRLVLPGSLERTFCLFPCPWRKHKDVKHRLHTREFWRLLGSRTVRGGTALLVTDWQPYTEWVRGQLDDTGWDCELTVVPPRLHTRYERKWCEQGQQEFFEFRLVLRRPLDLPLLECVALHVHRVDRFEPARFVAPELLGPGLTLRPKELLFDPVREVAMLRMVIVEEHLMQHLWIRITRRGELWKIFPSTGTGYIPTVGVQRALECVRDACVAAGAVDRGTEVAKDVEEGG